MALQLIGDGKAMDHQVEFVNFERKKSINEDGSFIDENIDTSNLTVEDMPQTSLDDTNVKSLNDCNEIIRNSFLKEFDEALDKLKKIDCKCNLSKEQLSLGLIDEFFGKLYTEFDNTNENIPEDQNSKLFLKIENNTKVDQKICGDFKNNIEKHIIAFRNVNEPIKLVHNIDTRINVTKNKSTDTNEMNTLVQQLDNCNEMDYFNQQSRNTGNTFKNNSIEYALKELQTSNDKIDSEKEVSTTGTDETCTKVSESANNGRSKTIILIHDGSSNDENCPTNVKNNCKPENVIYNKTINLISEESSDDDIYITNLKKECFNKELEVITISSMDDNDSHCSGYCSSDFEFISESEAKLCGIVSNPALKKEFSVKPPPAPKVVRAVNPVAGSSRSPPFANNLVRNNMPQGGDYLNLFRGIYDPELPFSQMCNLENKSTRLTTMSVEFEGYDMPIRNRRESTDDELIEESNRTRRKILSTYSRVNRGRRDPFRRRQK